MTATATLLDSQGAPLAGHRVVLQRISSTVTTLGAGLTDAQGCFAVKLSPVSRIVMRAVFAGDAETSATVSPRVSVSPRVIAARPWTHDRYAYPGQLLPARGSLWPKHSRTSTATVLRCERFEHGTWVLRARYRAPIVNTTTSSTFRGVIKFPSAGYWRVRVEHVDSGHARTYGPATYVKVTDWRARYSGVKVGGFQPPRKVVAITIDDGPNRRTMDICRILERYGARGTFFFTNQLLLRGYQGDARRAYDRGHEIANHTAHHKMLTGSYDFSYREASATIRTIRAATGFRPTWIRAMGGGIDSTGMRAVVNTGQLYVNWSVDSYDSHQRYLPPSVIYRNVVNHVRSGDVILLHQTHPESVAALPAICAELKRRGYEMVTVSELAAMSRRR